MLREIPLDKCSFSFLKTRTPCIFQHISVVLQISSTSGNWEKSSVDRFKSLLDYKVLSAKFHTKQPPYQVSLFEDGKSLAETALGQGIGIAAASSNQNRGYNNRKLDVGTVENVYVAHIDDMRNIYCQLTRTENALYACRYCI